MKRAISIPERLTGVRLDFRPVTPADAEYIFALRTDSALNSHLSPVQGSVEDQVAWIEGYKPREARGEEFYFAIERKDERRCGVVRVYNLTEDRFTWGSWVLDENKPRKAALDSAVLLYDFAFGHLGLARAAFDVRRENSRTLAFHDRFGARRTGEDDQDIYFEYDKFDFAAAREHFLTVLTEPES